MSVNMTFKKEETLFYFITEAKIHAAIPEITMVV